MKEFVDAVKRLVDLMPTGAALPHFYARDELVKVRELLGDAEKLLTPLDPVEGDLLPPIGAKVQIHLGRQDAWVDHVVVGYYVWGPLNGDKKDFKYYNRVFVRVVDVDGILNARLLKDVRW